MCIILPTLCQWLVQCCSGLSGEGEWKSTTSGEFTSSELTSGESMSRKSSALGVIPGDGTEVRRGNIYEQWESGRGEGR
jgi:hypothetical protein